MPWLDYPSLRGLRETPVEQCPDCQMAVYKSYCRKCDVFCWLGHGHLCQSVQAIEDREHEEHRHY